MTTTYIPGQALYAAPASEIAIPPGETLREILDELGMSQAEFARRTDLSTKHVNQLVHGIVSLSADIAQRCEFVTGIPARTWSRLEADYQSVLAATSQREALERDVAWLAEMPVRELVSAGYLPEEPVDKPDRVDQLLRFFGVSSVKAYRQLVPAAGVAFRQSSAYTVDPNAIAAWLRIGELESAGSELAEFDADRFRSAMPALAKLTILPPREALTEMVDELRRLGVALIFVSEIKGTRSFGATRWTTKRSPLIQLSLRGKTVDRIWKTLFHEFGHILLHDRKAVFVEGFEELSSAGAPDIELEADVFAIDQLIPTSQQGRLSRGMGLADAASFAEELGIDAGIVVAELQRRGVWSHSQGNRLRRPVSEDLLPGEVAPDLPDVKPSRRNWSVPGADQ